MEGGKHGANFRKGFLGAGHENSASLVETVIEDKIHSCTINMM